MRREGRGRKVGEKNANMLTMNYHNHNNSGFLLLYEMMMGRAHIRICPNIRPVSLKAGVFPNKENLVDEKDKRQLTQVHIYKFFLFIPSFL